MRQSEVSSLQERLDAIDARESSPLFLGSTCGDRNVERKNVLRDLEDALERYGSSSPRFSSSYKYETTVNTKIERSSV